MLYGNNIRKNVLTITLTASILTFVSTTYAAPVISNIEGTLEPGATLQITGSGFGTKATAQPFKWDDFENGTLGEHATTQGWLSYGGAGGPTYSSSNPHTGAQSVLTQTNYVGDYFDTAGLKGLNSLEVYISTWFYFEKVSGNYDKGNPVIKVLRVNSYPAGDFYTGSTSSPSFWLTDRSFGNPGAGTSNDNGSYTHSSYFENDFIEGKWHRIELYFKLSQPAGSNNGEVSVWLDGNLNYTHNTGITRTTSEDGKVLDNFLLPAMIDRGGQVMNYFVDDVYVDTTRSRVELCTASTWSNCMEKSIQVPSTWSNTSITISSARLGTLPADQPLYMYVIDANGVANANGYEIGVVRPNTPAAFLVQ